MKIIHILNELKFSGAEIMYVDAAPYFQKKGCQLSVLSTTDNLGEFSPIFKEAGYEVFHKPMPPLKNYWNRIRYYNTIIKFLKKENFDIVHIHSSSARWGFALCAKLANIKSIYTFHNVFSCKMLTYPYHYMIRWSAKRLFQCSFQTISDSVYDNELKVYKNKTTKVYNWYGNNRFYPAKTDEKNVFRKELGIAEDALVLISIGGCSDIKRHTEIIKALPLIIEKKPEILYIHLGEGCTLVDEKDMASNLGILDKIMFCGNQSDVRKFLVASDIYLMTSLFEGISLTTIEAMACKIPAILYNVPGLKDFNKMGNNSLLIDEDYRKLASTILKLNESLQLQKELIENAESMVLREFYLPTNANKIIQLYKD